MKKDVLLRFLDNEGSLSIKKELGKYLLVYESCVNGKDYHGGVGFRSLEHLSKILGGTVESAIKCVDRIKSNKTIKYKAKL